MLRRKNIGKPKRGKEDLNKEQWARIKCGSVSKRVGKGFKGSICRVCGKAVDTIEHILNCGEAKNTIKTEVWLENLNKWINATGRKNILQGILEKVMQAEQIEEICDFTRAFERLVRKVEEERKEDKGRVKTGQTETNTVLMRNKDSIR